MEKKAKVKLYLKDHATKIQEVNEKIWEFAELAFNEYNSAGFLTEELKKEGFMVAEGVAGIPTAFIASYGHGEPTIGLLAEYDALPYLSQKSACSEHSPLIDGGNGHGCGHNALGAGVYGAALAVRDYIRDNNIQGTVQLFGCPAEEGGSGKAFMARAGLFDHLDAAITWHPADKNEIWDISSQACIMVKFHFKGKSAHAASSPHFGRSALDSVEIMNVGVNYLREHISNDARVHYAYLDAGGIAPNVVQNKATVLYYIRHKNVPLAMGVFERVKDIAKGAALINGTETSYEVVAGMSDYVPNGVLSQILYEAFIEYGGPEFDEEDYRLANKFVNTLSEEVRNTIKNNLIKKYGTEKGEEIFKKSLETEIEPFEIKDITMFGSTDVGDVSYVVPTAQLRAATLAIGTPNHTWQNTAQHNSSIALKGINSAAGAMALAVINCMENPEVLVKAKEEYIKTTGGKYICPMPNDVLPPTVNLL